MIDITRASTGNFNRMMVVVAADIIVLIQLTVAMYVSSLTPDEFTPQFVKLFVGMAIPTVVITIVLLRRLDRKARINAPVEGDHGAIANEAA